MKDLTEEERKVVDESMAHVREATNKVFEDRLKAEVGPEMAEKIMAKIDNLVRQNLSQDEIVERLKKDPDIPEAGVGGAILMGGAITAGGIIAYSQM